MKWGKSDRLRENNKNTCAHGHMDLKIGPHLKQVPLVTRKGGPGRWSTLEGLVLGLARER